MRWVVITLALGGFGIGLAAARDWYEASQICPVPAWGDREPVDPHLSQMGWIVGMLNAASESGRLNRRAALLTAVAVVLSTGSGVAGLFA